MLSGVSAKEKPILWIVFVWIIMAGGPGLLLANRAEFIGPLPVLYVYELVMFMIGIAISYHISYRTKFCNVDEIEEELKNMKREGGDIG